MESTDVRIIGYLEQKGLQTSSKISKELNVPICTVHRHLKKLLQKENINVVVHTNPLILGYENWIRVGINTLPSLHRRVVDYLVSHQSIYTLSEVVNGFNILAGARFKTEDALIMFISEDLPALEGISNLEVFVITRPRKYFQFYWPTKNQDRSGEDTNNVRYELDEIDRSILGIITVKGPESATRLSKQLGIGSATIQQHVKRMLDNRVFSTEVRVNPEFRDSEMLVTVGIIVSGRTTSEVLDEVMAEDLYIDTASLSIGRFNIILGLHFHSIELLNRLVNVKLRNIPGIVSIETFIHTKRLKYYTSQY
jgi:Lrp/AsnC family transcriptional regulator, regulator for asnA, asnC and gidA